MYYNNDYIKAVARIEKDTFADYWSEDSIKDTLKWEYNHLLIAYIESPDDVKFVDDTEKTNINGDNVNDGHIIGYVLYSIVAGESEMYRIAIDQRYRKLGYASKIIKKYLDIISKRATKSFLEVREGNEAAIILYERNNYKVIANRKNYYSNPTENALIYELVLP